MPESEPAAERVVTELAGMPQPARRHQLRTAMAAARSSPRVCVGGGGGGGGGRSAGGLRQVLCQWGQRKRRPCEP